MMDKENKNKITKIENKNKNKRYQKRVFIFHFFYIQIVCFYMCEVIVILKWNKKKLKNQNVNDVVEGED